MSELEFLKAENKELKERLLQAAKENNRMNMRLQQVLSTITNAAAAIASEYADFTAAVFADTEKLEAEFAAEAKAEEKYTAEQTQPLENVSLVNHQQEWATTTQQQRDNERAGDEVVELEHTDKSLSVTTQDTELAHALEYRREKHEEDCADYVNRRYSLLMSGLDIPEPEARRLAKEYFLKEHPVPTVETVAEEVVPSFKPQSYGELTGRTMTSSEAVAVAEATPLFESLLSKATALLNGESCTLSANVTPDVKIVFDKPNSLLVLDGKSERLSIVVNTEKGFDISNESSVALDFDSGTTKAITQRSLGELINLKHILSNMAIVVA